MRAFRSPVVVAAIVAAVPFAPSSAAMAAAPTAPPAVRASAVTVAPIALPLRRIGGGEGIACIEGNAARPYVSPRSEWRRCRAQRWGAEGHDGNRARRPR